MTLAISDELRLLLACSAWPPSPDRSMDIRRAAHPGIDWPRFLQLVERHRVVGMVQDALVKAGIEPPPAIARRISEPAHALARRNLALAAETLRLQRVFDTAGIPAAFVKGITLAMLVHGNPALRHSKDIDLLVDEVNAEAAHALIEQLWLYPLGATVQPYGNPISRLDAFFKGM